MREIVYIALLVVANDVVIAILCALAVRLLFGRPIQMAELQALQTAIAQLTTDVNALVAAGVIPATALTALTTTITQLDTQIKALLPAPPAA